MNGPDDRSMSESALPRRLFCYGGPLDGTEIMSGDVPEGYTDFGASLVIWEALDFEALPMWQGWP